LSVLCIIGHSLIRRFAINLRSISNDNCEIDLNLWGRAQNLDLILTDATFCKFVICDVPVNSNL